MHHHPTPHGHPFVRPGQVAPDRPAPDKCMQCGEPEASHPGGGLRAAAGRLEALTGVLGTALATWATRDDAKARPAVRQAANTALAAIDDQLAALHKIRQQLVSQIRVSDDATAARVDAMLAGAEHGHQDAPEAGGIPGHAPAPDADSEVSFKLTSGQSQADPGPASTAARS